MASVSLEFLEKRHVGYFILPVRENRGIAFARHGRAIALLLDAVYAKILEIERIPLVAIRAISVVHQNKL